jgi:hypothetical protein
MNLVQQWNKTDAVAICTERLHVRSMSEWRSIACHPALVKGVASHLLHWPALFSDALQFQAVLLCNV